MKHVGTPPPPEEDPKTKKKRERAERKDDLNYEIEIAELDKRLKGILNSAEFKKEKTAKEKLQEKFNEYDARVMGAHALAKEQKLKDAETYKDDPELLEKAKERLDRWVDDQT